MDGLKEMKEKELDEVSGGKRNPGEMRRWSVKDPDDYVVRPGDAIYRIAQRYGIDPEEAVRHNGQLKDPGLIRPGETVQISTKE